MSEEGLLFSVEQLEAWRVEWKGMPEFAQEDLGPIQTINVHFDSRSSVEAFAELVGQNISERTRDIWFPAREVAHLLDRKRYSDEL